MAFEQTSNRRELYGKLTLKAFDCVAQITGRQFLSVCRFHGST